MYIVETWHDSPGCGLLIYAHKKNNLWFPDGNQSSIPVTLSLMLFLRIISKIVCLPCLVILGM